ncbi:MAG: hypothetical protein ACP5M4_11005 [Acidobacteriaceae bacterium]
MNHPDTHPNAADHIIDRALHQLGSAEPRDGINNRILYRLRQAEFEPAPHAIAAWPRLALASLAGACLCATIVIGTVQHSHAVAAQNHPVLPILRQQNGVATASSTHISAHPVIAPQGGGRSDQHLGQGRANVKPGTHIHGGDGIPVPPRVQ